MFLRQKFFILCCSAWDTLRYWHDCMANEIVMIASCPIACSSSKIVLLVIQNDWYGNGFFMFLCWVLIFERPEFLLQNECKSVIVIECWVWVAVFLEGHRYMLNGISDCANSQSYKGGSWEYGFADATAYAPMMTVCMYWETFLRKNLFLIPIDMQYCVYLCHAQACFLCVPLWTALSQANSAAMQSATRLCCLAVVEFQSELEAKSFLACMVPTPRLFSLIFSLNDCLVAAPPFSCNKDIFLSLQLAKTPPPLTVGDSSMQLDLTLLFLEFDSLTVICFIPKVIATILSFHLMMIPPSLGALLRSIGCRIDVEEIAVRGSKLLMTKGGFMHGRAPLGPDQVPVLVNCLILAR